MPYIREICKAGKIVEVIKYHTYKYNRKGENHSEKKNKTTLCQIKVNMRAALKKLRRLMNANFQDGDYLTTLDFKPEYAPAGSVEMQEYMSEFLKKLRKEYKKAGLILKYIYVKEVGKRGGRHIHMIHTKCEIEILRKCWIWGGIHVDPLWTDGQYEDIAKYFLKYADKTIETEGAQLGKKYYPSKNLEKPKVDKEVIEKHDTFNTHIMDKAGYYLDKSSVTEGVTEEGYRVFRYYLHELPAEHKKRTNTEMKNVEGDSS